jgi:hypothetical protein
MVESSFEILSLIEFAHDPLFLCLMRIFWINKSSSVEGCRWINKMSEYYSFSCSECTHIGIRNSRCKRGKGIVENIDRLCCSFEIFDKNIMAGLNEDVLKN